MGPPTPMTPEHEHEFHDETGLKPSSRGPSSGEWAPALALGLGVGALCIAAVVAVMAIFFGTPNRIEERHNAIRFTDIRLPVNCIVAMLAVLVISIVVSAVVRRSALLWSGVVTTLVIGSIVLPISGFFYIMNAPPMDHGDLRGTGYAATLGAFWAAIGGLVLTAVGVLSATDPRVVGRPLAGTVMTAVIVAVGGVVILSPPVSSATDQMIAIERKDVHQVDNQLPTSVQNSVRPIPNTVEGSGAYPVGPGFIVTDAVDPTQLTMYNGDDLTVRWQLRVNGVNNAQTRVQIIDDPAIVVVSVFRVHTDRVNVGIDASSGVKLWENSEKWGASPREIDSSTGDATTAPHIVKLSEDRAISVYDPHTGDRRFTHRARTDCQFLNVTDRATTIEFIRQCSDNSRTFDTIDAHSGVVVSSRSEPLDHDEVALPIGYRFAYDEQNNATEPTAVADSNGRRVLDLRADEVVNCAMRDECVVRPKADGPHRVVSLSGVHPPLILDALPGTVGPVLWLDDQLLIAASQTDQNARTRGGSILVLDRKTRDTTMIRAVADELRPYRGGVIVVADTQVRESITTVATPVAVLQEK